MTSESLTVQHIHPLGSSIKSDREELLLLLSMVPSRAMIVSTDNDFIKADGSPPPNSFSITAMRRLC
eukprot:scaffold53117_cov24-Cyclotella_meneghiniana.AAC.1